MKIKDMEKIAADRTPGKFHEWYYSRIEDMPMEQQLRNMAFIAMAANSFEALLDIAIAASRVTPWISQDCAPYKATDLRIALKRLKDL